MRMVSITIDQKFEKLIGPLQEKHSGELVVFEQKPLADGTQLIQLVVLASGIATALAPILREIFSFVKEKSKLEHSIIEITDGDINVKIDVHGKTQKDLLDSAADVVKQIREKRKDAAAVEAMPVSTG